MSEVIILETEGMLAQGGVVNRGELNLVETNADHDDFFIVGYEFKVQAHRLFKGHSL